MIASPLVICSKAEYSIWAQKRRKRAEAATLAELARSNDVGKEHDFALTVAAAPRPSAAVNCGAGSMCHPTKPTWKNPCNQRLTRR